jgi:hypothetical protein
VDGDGGGAPCTPIQQIVKPQVEGESDKLGQWTCVGHKKKNLNQRFPHERNLLEYKRV